MGATVCRCAALATGHMLWASELELGRLRTASWREVVERHQPDVLQAEHIVLGDVLKGGPSGPLRRRHGPRPGRAARRCSAPLQVGARGPVDRRTGGGTAAAPGSAPAPTPRSCSASATVGCSLRRPHREPRWSRSPSVGRCRSSRSTRSGPIRQRFCSSVISGIRRMSPRPRAPLSESFREFGRRGLT